MGEDSEQSNKDGQDKPIETQNSVSLWILYSSQCGQAGWHEGIVSVTSDPV